MDFLHVYAKLAFREKRSPLASGTARPNYKALCQSEILSKFLATEFLKKGTEGAKWSMTMS